MYSVHADYPGPSTWNGHVKYNLKGVKYSCAELSAYINFARSVACAFDRWLGLVLQTDGIEVVNSTVQRKPYTSAWRPAYVNELSQGHWTTYASIWVSWYLGWEWDFRHFIIREGFGRQVILTGYKSTQDDISYSYHNCLSTSIELIRILNRTSNIMPNQKILMTLLHFSVQTDSENPRPEL